MTTVTLVIQDKQRNSDACGRTANEIRMNLSPFPPFSMDRQRHPLF